MRFPEDSFESVGRASVVLPAAIEQSWGPWPGRPAERDLANACRASCRRQSIVAEWPRFQIGQEQATMAGHGNDGFKMSYCSFQPPTKVEVEPARGRGRTRSSGFVFKGVEGGEEG